MPNSMVYKNDTISDLIEIANAFNDYFINVGTNITLSNNDSNTFNQKEYKKKRRFFNRKTLINLYPSFIFPYLIYCVEI